MSTVCVCVCVCAHAHACVWRAGAWKIIQSITVLILKYKCKILTISKIQYFCHSVLKYFKNSFPSGSEGKVSACSAGDLGLIPGLGSSPGEGNGNPLQYSCLENPMDREAW